MNDQVKEVYDKTSILKDISDREQIIRDYQLTGHLDRNKAIRIIQELRLTDADVAMATTTRLAVSAIPFDQTPDHGIIAELKMQIDVLATKLLTNKI